MKPAIGVINLGCTPGGDYWNAFVDKLREAIDPDFWDVVAEGTPESGKDGYKSSELFGITEDTYSAIVLSPGNAKIKLRTENGQFSREREEEVGRLYNIIDAVIAKKIPIIGFNAGHQALCTSHGWFPKKVPDDQIEAYKTEQTVQIEGTNDPIFTGVSELDIKLGNSYVCNGKSADSTMRERQEQVGFLLNDNCGFPLITRIGDGIVYGSQANIKYVGSVVKNFFDMAQADLEARAD